MPQWYDDMAWENLKGKTGPHFPPSSTPLQADKTSELFLLKSLWPVLSALSEFR